MLELGLSLNLEEIQALPNIAEEIDTDTLAIIGNICKRGYDDDFASTADWRASAKRIIELVDLEAGPKSTPDPVSSNVKLPMINTAVVQYASRTVSGAIQNGRVAHAYVLGEDPTGVKIERAERISKHMSWQLLFDDMNWEDDTDRLAAHYALVGMGFRKTYYDEVTKKIKSVALMYDECIMSNYAVTVNELRRKTHRIPLHRNDVVSAIRTGLFLDVDQDLLPPISHGHVDGENTFEVLEQHAFLDLDGDGYEEPYIITFLKQSGLVLRIVARWDTDGIMRNEKGRVQCIKPVEYFTIYKYLHAPDGSFYGIGLGQLLSGVVRGANSLINITIDSGRRSVSGGGICDEQVRLPGGILEITPNTYRTVDANGVDKLGDHFKDWNFPPPSPVVLQLLQTLDSYGKEIASINDAMTGDMKTQNVPATTALAVINQGTQVLKAVQRRFYRSLGEELDKLYRLNRLYLTDIEYFTFIDSPMAIAKSDYEDKSLDIRPVADPSMASEVQRMVKVQALMQGLENPAISQELDSRDIAFRFVKAIDADSPEKSLKPIDNSPKPPAPEQLEIMSQIDKTKGDMILAKDEQFIRHREISMQEQEAAARIALLDAQADKAKADAIAVLAGVQMQSATLELKRLEQKAEALSEPVELKSASGDTKQGDPAPQPEIAGELDQVSTQQPEIDSGDQANLPPVDGAPSDSGPGQIPV